MKINKKTLISFLLMLCLVAGSLTACGKKGDDSQAVAEGETSAEAKADESHVCIGYWKYDDASASFYIAKDLSWVAYNADGQVSNTGTIEIIDDKGFRMVFKDSDRVNEYTVVDENKLIDQDRDAVSRVFGASSEDSLDMTANFPGKFEGFTVNYPSKMTATPDSSVANCLDFFNVDAFPSGIPDGHSFVKVSFHPLVNADQFLTQGAYLAKPAMTKLMNNSMQTLYGNYLIKTIGTDFQDMGTYYRATGYMALDSSMFSNQVEGETLMGIMELRYFGPTGYILCSTAVAPVETIENYYKISLNILNTCTYKTDWSTQPPAKKAAKTSKPAKKSKTKQVTKKQASNQTTIETYYWTDADGDIWYFNGYEDIFYCYGDRGYIDDDTGEFMESNDAGWADDLYYEDYLDYDDYEDLYDSYLDEDYEAYDGYDDYDEADDYDSYYDNDDYNDYDYDSGYDDYGYDDYGDDW